jgi:hypothetical protein
MAHPVPNKESLMKKYFLSLSILFCLVQNVWAEGPAWRHNHLRQQGYDDRIREEMNKIPIYREKLEGNYKIIGPVHGEDLFTAQKSAIFWAVREQAYNSKADAIMEFKCRRMVKSTFQQCEGFAIRYLKDGEKDEVKSAVDTRKEKKEAKQAKKEEKQKAKEEKESSKEKK